MNIALLSNCAVLVSRPIMNEMLRFPASLRPAAPRANRHEQSWFMGRDHRWGSTKPLENYAAHKHLLYQHSGYLL
jgi:hypothetical protein